MAQPLLSISTDQPLEVTTALNADKLDRTGFAKAVVSALDKVSSSRGFVVSIEGNWGSGKTSTLAMIEALLEKKSGKHRPIVVRFNPWLVGERDALLRHFLATIASVIQLADSSKDAKKAAKELKTYAKAFDFVKFIPGAEPWASLVKSVIEAMGDATESIAEYKTPDIEARKDKVERALRNYERPVIVVVDDIDRLFPQEVFEMVRIIKAVGDLPNVGYLLAWDTTYVSTALQSLNIPKSDSYLDKIVQVRMALPSLSSSAREQLINDAIDTLAPEAIKGLFPNDKDRLTELYLHGLREVLEQPRDFTRVFNTVSVIEPSLRGELALADIVGFAALMVKAPAVADLLRKYPQWFVGTMPGDESFLKKSSELVKEGESGRQEAYENSSRPNSVRNMVQFLFPQVAESDGESSSYSAKDIEGHIASPPRLLIALQCGVSPRELSLVKARRYLQMPDQRAEIVQTLTENNCFEFLEQIGNIAGNVGDSIVSDFPEVCLAVARLVDCPPFTNRAQKRHGVFSQRASTVARRTIDAIVEVVDAKRGAEVAKGLVLHRQSISTAAEIVALSFLLEERPKSMLIASASTKAVLLKAFANNVLSAAADGSLMKLSQTSYVLWILSGTVPTKCKEVFLATKAHDPSLDQFAVEVLKNSYDSVKGQTLAVDLEYLEKFVSIDEFKDHAKQRLSDSALKYPERAAWKTVVSDKRLYAVDGTEVD